MFYTEKEYNSFLNTRQSVDTEDALQRVRTDKEDIKTEKSEENDTEGEKTAETKLTDKCELIATKHTASGDDIWVVTLKDRVSPEEYKELSSKVKAVGGYYSRFAKTPEGKAIPGFVFKSEPTAKELSVFNDFFGYSEAAPADTSNTVADEVLKNQPENCYNCRKNR